MLKIKKFFYETSILDKIFSIVFSLIDGDRMESVLQLAFYFVFESIADKFDYIDDEDENISFLNASYKYIMFMLTNILACVIVNFLQKAFDGIFFLFVNLKPHYARIFFEIVLLLLQPYILSEIQAMLNSNLILIRLAHFVSCLIKITIYSDIFNNFLYSKCVNSEEIAQGHRLAKKLSTREICIRIAFFSFYSLFTYFFNIFPLKCTPIDFLAIFLFYDLSDENFRQKVHEFNFERIFRLTKRTPMTFYECLPYIAGIKFICFSFQYLLNNFKIDKTNEEWTLILDEMCDRSDWLPKRNAQYDSLQTCVNVVLKILKLSVKIML
jgi:hypothetical protein